MLSTQTIRSLLTSTFNSLPVLPPFSAASQSSAQPFTLGSLLADITTPSRKAPVPAETLDAALRGPTPLADLAIQRLMSHIVSSRCSDWAGQNMSLAHECREAAHEMVTIVDMRSFALPTGMASAAFPREFVRIIHETDAIRFIHEAHSYLNASHRGTPSSTANLWDIALRVCRNDHRKAIRLMALLFQDTDFLPHIRLLEALYPNDENVGKLRDLCVAIHDEKKMENGNVVTGPKLFTYYPDRLDQTAPSNAQYHFYVIAHLARCLVESGIRPEVAHIVVSVLNSVYVLRRHGILGGLTGMPSSLEGFRGRSLQEVGTLLSLFAREGVATLRETWKPFYPKDIPEDASSRTPRTGLEGIIPRVNTDDFFADLYLGLCGGAFGSGLDTPNADRVRKMIFISPDALMGNLFLGAAL